MKNFNTLDWHKIHTVTVYLFSIISTGYAITKTIALAKLINSPTLAIGQNITLLLLCMFFTLFACTMVAREPDKATFATVGAILTALVI